MAHKQPKEDASLSQLKAHFIKQSDELNVTTNSDAIRSAKYLQSLILLWTRKVDLIQELKDAQRDIQKDPKNASNYLVLGVLYAIQGDYGNSHHVLEQGISMVTTEDPLYPLLNDWVNEAKARSQNHIDIVSRIPHDILGQISNNLTQDDISQCFQVCRFWRSTWLQISDPWSKICFFKSSDTILAHGVLPLISRHVQKIYIKSSPVEALRALEDIRACNISALKSFSVISETIKVEDDREYIDSNAVFLVDGLYTTLSCIGETLNSLKLEIIMAGQGGLSLERIIPSCPNLTRFQCKCDYIIDPFFGSCWLTSNTALTHINLESQQIDTSVVESLLRRSPQLTDLALQHCDASKILSILQQSCGKLNLLRLNSTGDDQFYKLEERSNQDDVFVFIGNLENSSYLFPFLEQRINTLKCFVIEECKGDWNALSAFTAPNLKTLDISVEEAAPTRDHLINILQHHPQLENLRLKCGYENIVLDLPPKTIDYMQNLVSLSLCSVDTEGVLYLQLMEMYAARGQDASLSSLEIIGYEPPNTKTLLTATAIKSLTHLTLRFYNAATIHQQEELYVLKFARQISQLPKLQELVLDGFSNIFTEEMAHYITQCKLLRTLVVSGLQYDICKILEKDIARVYLIEKFEWYH